MREILFRGKRIDNGEWVEGHLVCDREFWGEEDFHAYIVNHGHPSGCFGHDIYIEVDPDTVGQFTGLMDINRRKIFEGDIVKNTRPDANRKFTGPVRWSGLFCGWSVNDVISLYGQIERYEVVGNEFDNTEE